MFRFSIGNYSCKNCEKKGSLHWEMCNFVTSKLNSIRLLPLEKIQEIPKFEMAYVQIRSKKAILSISRESYEGDQDVIVIQLFVPLIVGANFFSLRGVGRMVAEGFVVSRDGLICDLDESFLLKYR